MSFSEGCPTPGASHSVTVNNRRAFCLRSFALGSEKRTLRQFTFEKQYFKRFEILRRDERKGEKLSEPDPTGRGASNCRFC